MPVTKFNDPDDARRALWIDSNHPRLAQRIRRLWEFSRRLASPGAPKGVQYFPSIEAANRERDSRSLGPSGESAD